MSYSKALTSIAAAAVTAAGIGGAIAARGSTPGPELVGVCVSYGLLKGHDIRYVASIYTPPSSGRCAEGDTFVPDGAGLINQRHR